MSLLSFRRGPGRRLGVSSDWRPWKPTHSPSGLPRSPIDFYTVSQYVDPDDPRIQANNNLAWGLVRLAEEADLETIARRIT